MAKAVKRSPAPVYCAAAVWLVWGLFMPLYRPLDFLSAAVAALIVAMIGKAIFPDKSYDLPQQTAQSAKPEAEKPSGDPEIDALTAERDKALGEMKRLNESIRDPKLSGQIDHLEEDTRKIIAHVVEHPDKLPQIRKFMSYYLPTTLKLLNAYDRMAGTGISGENIDATKAKVENMMDTIVTAFDRQLDALFGDEALDIATDITVMENLLRQEGLGGTEFAPEETGEDPDGGVTLQL